MIDFSIFSKSLKAYAVELNQVRSEIEGLERKREDILYAPANRADVSTAMVAWVARRRAEYLGYLEKIIKPLQNVPGNAVDPAQVDARLRSAGLSGDRIEFHHIEADLALAGLFGDLLTESLQKAIAAMPWPDGEGLPMAQRAGEVAKVDAQLQKLRKKESDLIASAESAGISVE